METPPLDIHTHRLPTVPGTAIVNAAPEGFSPLPGMYYSVGLHPWHLDGNGGNDEALDRLRRAASHLQVLAIGEAGLDRLATAPPDVQQRVFCQQALLAEELGMPLIIHLVKAADELLALHRRLRPQVPWIIHGFRGKPQQAGQLLRQGLYLSFGEHYHPEALRLVPEERLFLETDESTVPFGCLCEKAALVRGTDATGLALTLAANVADTFFGQ